MASVSRRRGCKIWSAFFRDLDGRLRCRSTGTESKGLALRIAQEYEQAVRQKKTLRQIQRTLEGFREELTGEVTPRATLRQFADGWLGSKQYETAPGTFKFYTESVRKLLSHLRGELPMGDVTRNQILDYRNALSACLSGVTVNHHLGVARMLFKAARRDGLIADDPSEFVEPVKGKAGAKRPFRLEELRAALEVADPEWRSMILFGLYTGQRLGDIAQLTWANLDLPRRTLRLVTQKTHKTLIIPMAEPLVRHVMSLPVSDELDSPLHPRAFGFLEAHGRTGGLSTQFTKLLAQAGLRPYQPHRSQGKGRDARRELAGLSFHSLRHTATTLLHEAGVPVAVVKELIGYSSLAVHEGYISVGNEALKRAADSLPDLL